METNHQNEKELNKPLNWWQKIMYKKAIKKLKNKIEQYQKEDKTTKEKLIKAINEMQEMIEIYEDDECKIPTTKEHLEKKTIKELDKLIIQMLTEAEKQI